MLSLRHQLQERSEEVSLLAEDCVIKDERIQELERAVSVVAQAVLPLQQQQQQQQQQPPLPPGPPPSGTPTAAPGAAAATLPPPRLPALPSVPTASNGKASRGSIGPPPSADAQLGQLPAAPSLPPPPQQESLSAGGQDIASMRLALRAINQ